MKKLFLVTTIIIISSAVYFLFFVNEKKPEGSFDISGAESDNGIIYLNTSPQVKYIGSENCLPCHKSTHNTFSHSEMKRSMEVLSDKNIIEDYSGLKPVHDPVLNYFYEMIKTDSGFYQREFRLDPDSKVYHERFMKAVYTIGSGNNLRMYFYDDNGMFYQLPLTWYTNKKNWDLSPGYRNNGNLRFSRYATRKCITCHNAYLKESAAALDRYETPYQLGVNCERCHGPGEMHVKEMNDEIKNLSSNMRTIVNPAKLSSERQLSVCMQCHAQGKAWAMQNEDGWFDFRPAQLLSSNRSIYYPQRTNKNVIEVGESPYRLKLSKCFTESNGKLSCITCHNPHRSIKTFTISEYNEKCLSCHSIEKLPLKENKTNHLVSDDCVSCHMNKTGTENTLHGVPLTDHWIRRDAYKDKIDWSSVLASPKDLPVIQLIADVDADDQRKEIRKGIAYLDFYQEYDNKKVYLDSALLYLNNGIKKNNNDAAAHFYIGEAYSLLGNYSDALSAYKKAVDLNPQYDEAYFKLAETYKIYNDNEAAIKFYSEALNLKSGEPAYLEGLAYAYVNVGNYSEAVALFEKAVDLDGQNANTFYTLGTIYAIQFQQPEKSLNYFKKASILNPDLENVFLNLGNAFSLSGNFHEAEKAYKKELYARPRSISAKINLARLYKTNGRTAEANKLLKDVLAEDPDNEIAKLILDSN